MDAERPTNDEGIATRRYTGRTRLEAEAGFACDRPALTARYSLLAEAWDEDTHTLTVFLTPRVPNPRPDRV